MAKRPPDQAEPQADAATEQPSTMAVQAAPVPIQEPAGGWPADEFTGIGGCYVRDPFTGVRSIAPPAIDLDPGTSPDPA